MAVSEKRRGRLLEIAAEYETEIVKTTLQKSQNASKGNISSGDMIGGAVKKKSKKNDKEA